MIIYNQFARQPSSSLSSSLGPYLSSGPKTLVESKQQLFGCNLNGDVLS